MIKVNAAICLLTLALLRVSVYAGDKPGQQAQGRPNVLFISVDDLNDFPTLLKLYPDAKTHCKARFCQKFYEKMKGEFEGPSCE